MSTHPAFLSVSAALGSDNTRDDCGALLPQRPIPLGQTRFPGQELRDLPDIREQQSAVAQDAVMLRGHLGLPGQQLIAFRPINTAATRFGYRVASGVRITTEEAIVVCDIPAKQYSGINNIKRCFMNNARPISDFRQRGAGDVKPKGPAYRMMLSYVRIIRLFDGPVIQNGTVRMLGRMAARIATINDSAIVTAVVTAISVSHIIFELIRPISRTFVRGHHIVDGIIHSKNLAFYGAGSMVVPSIVTEDESDVFTYDASSSSYISSVSRGPYAISIVCGSLVRARIGVRTATTVSRIGTSPTTFRPSSLVAVLPPSSCS